MRTMNKEQQRGRPRRTENFCTTFSSINKAFSVQKYPATHYCVCLILSPWSTEVPILSTNQRTACVAQTCRYPFRVSVPQRRSTARRVRLSAAQSGSRPLFCSGNATRSAPLRTEPTRTLRWKRAIIIKKML